MACTVCRIIHERCEDCCFKKFFGPQDKEKYLKIRRNNYPLKFIRATLSDNDISDEDKKGLIEKWCVYFNAKVKEKQAGSSSSKNEKKELQASKCQAASTSKMEVIAEKKGVQASSTNDLGCNDTCFFAALFSPEEKHKMVEIKNELGMEIVETEKQIMLERLFTKADELREVAQIMLEIKNKGDQDLL